VPDSTLIRRVTPGLFPDCRTEHFHSQKLTSRSLDSHHEKALAKVENRDERRYCEVIYFLKRTSRPKRRIILMSRQDGITFRLADSEDALQLADLRWRLKTDDSSNFSTTDRADFVAAFVACMTADSGRHLPFFHWVADLEGRLIAVMSVRKVQKVPSPHCLDRYWGYLTNCYTLPDYRNRGVGSSLLIAVKEWAKEQELELLIVWPSDRAYAFYERSGFRRDPDPLVLTIQNPSNS